MTQPAAEIAAETMCENAESQFVTPLTLIRFLRGQQAAILDVAACPRALALGAVLVLSAGFAREYDGEDLLHEPWHLLIPHGASLVTAFLLYTLVRLTGIGRMWQPLAFFSGFAMFLGLYWMTAPLAWLYAIPFERWMNPGDAMIWNLRLLGIVSVWRIVLMIRVIRVVYGAEPLWRVIGTVLLFGDAVMLTAIRFVPVPVLHLMGGVRMTDSERILQSTTLLLQIVGFPALFILLIITLVPSTTPWMAIRFSQGSRVHGTTWLTAAVAILIWPFILPMTQPEQQRRRMAEQLIIARDYHGAIQFMSQHEKSAFPPHWSPPPHVAMFNPSPPITDVIEVLIEEPAAEWVRTTFVEKFRNTIERTLGRYGFISDNELSSTLRILDRLPTEEWQTNDDWHAADVVDFLRGLASDKERTLSESDDACLERILAKLPPPVRHEELPKDAPLNDATNE